MPVVVDLDQDTKPDVVIVTSDNFSAGGASMVLPLRKALREGEAMCRNLGLGPFDRLMSALVKTTLYLPRKAKLWFNQFLSPLMGNEQRP
jgi:hypothetical protein